VDVDVFTVIDGLLLRSIENGDVSNRHGEG
jgi:hypothetical protein